MRKRITDPQFVRRILDEMKGQPTQLTADRIARDLGKRIRQRRRDVEYFNQAAVRIVREATEGK